METVPFLRAPLETVILGHHVPVATVPTRLVLLAMVIHVRVAMARTAHVSLVATANRAAGPHVAMVIHLPGRHGPAAIDPIRRGRRATARVQTVREAIARTVQEAIARIVREAIARIVHAPIALTATSHAVNGSPMVESVVRSARR
jgi:hypothetical protein